MEHRSKEGLTKAIIIDAILTGSDTRNALKERLNDIVTRKDLNYHLSKNTHNGLGFEHVLNERKGKISISMKNLNTISRAMDYLIKLPLTWCEMNDINKQAIMQITLEPDGSLRILPEVPDDQ